IEADAKAFADNDADLQNLSPRWYVEMPTGIVPFPYFYIMDLGESNLQRIGGPISGQPYIADVRFAIIGWFEGKAAADAGKELLVDKFDPLQLELDDGRTMDSLRELALVTDTGQMSENQKRVHQVTLHYKLMAQKAMPT